MENTEQTNENQTVESQTVEKKTEVVEQEVVKTEQEPFQTEQQRPPYEQKNNFYKKNTYLTRRDALKKIFKEDNIDYKRVDLLLLFLNSKGKILPTRYTRLSFKKQRKLSNLIKRARQAGLLPFVYNKRP